MKKFLVIDSDHKVIDDSDYPNVALYSANEYHDRTGKHADVYTRSITFFDDDGELRNGSFG